MLKKPNVNLNDPAIFGALGNSRTYYQYKKMFDDFAAGHCSFCHPENWRFPEIFRVGNWIVKKNDMPYANCEHHFVVVYVGRHVTNWRDLTRDEKADYMEAIEMTEDMFNIEGCAVVSRRGAIRRTAATLNHLHGHIMVVKLDEDGLPVGGLRAYFAKTREELQYCRGWVALFEKIRTGNITGVQKGFVVFKFGSYLNKMKAWEPCDQPDKAPILDTPLEDLKKICGNIGAEFYEVMTSAETGTVIMDGPFLLQEYEEKDVSPHSNAKGPHFQRPE